MDDKTNVNSVVDTTDCLEAIGVFKAAKNFFFIIIFICLIIVQSVFWLNYLGYIDASGTCGHAKQTIKSAVEVAPVVEEVVAKAAPAEVAVVNTDSAAVTIEDQAAKAVSDVSGAKVADVAVVEEPAVEVQDDSNALLSSIAKYIPNYHHIRTMVRLCNFILIFSATIYCLVLLMSIKISLVGRLGGISHISRAFFLSLFALVVLLPWQSVFGGFALGAIYAPAELFTKCTQAHDSAIVCQVMYFARFSGMWALSFLLLFAAQIRSAKWSKTTLRRLGILR